MYEVLTPNYRRAGDVSAVDWTVIGMADDMADAKAKFGAEKGVKFPAIGYDQ